MLLFTMAMLLMGYVFGCMNGAYYTGKLTAGIDVREYGSTNAGARNAGRVLGRRAFLYTTAADAIKTILPLLIVRHWSEGSLELAGGTAFAVLLGHLWPVQLQFRGGKGVVVYLASALVLAPFTLLFAAAGMAIGLVLKRRFTIAGFLGMILMPGALLFVSEPFLAGMFFIMLLIVAAMHRWDLN